jgi:hypothetical protein
MTEHLRREEFVDALERSLAPERHQHLDGCGECQASIARLREVLHETQSVDMPEPSPLFWDHFSDRVRQATALEPVSSPWWQPQGWWRPIGMAAAVAAAVMVGLVLWRPASAPVLDRASDVAAVVSPPDDGSWSLVMGLASEFDAADVREVAKPFDGTADAMIAELSAAQRRALAQLLKDEIGEQ